MMDAFNMIRLTLSKEGAHLLRTAVEVAMNNSSAWDDEDYHRLAYIRDDIDESITEKERNKQPGGEV